MFHGSTVESGAQVFSRLVQPPPLAPLHPRLFPNCPEPSEIIELSYEKGSPQNALLSQLVCNVLVPEEYGGKGARVIVLQTDGQFNVQSLIATVENTVKKVQPLELNHVIQKCLERLHVISVYDSNQMFIAVESIEGLLSKLTSASLVIVDTITAFYWSDRMFGSGVLKLDLYIANILKVLQTVTKDYRLTILYTRPHGANANCEESLDKYNVGIGHKVHLQSCSTTEDKGNIFIVNCYGHGNLNKFKFIVQNGFLCWL